MPTGQPSAHSAAPLAKLPVPIGFWGSICINFVVSLPKDSDDNNRIVVFVDCLSMIVVHLAAVKDFMDGGGTDKLFIDRVFVSRG